MSKYKLMHHELAWRIEAPCIIGLREPLIQFDLKADRCGGILMDLNLGCSLMDLKGYQV